MTFVGYCIAEEVNGKSTCYFLKKLVYLSICFANPARAKKIHENIRSLRVSGANS